MNEKSKHDGWTPQEQVQEQDPEDSAEFQKYLASEISEEMNEARNDRAFEPGDSEYISDECASADADEVGGL